MGDPGLGVEESIGTDISLRRTTGRVTGALTAFYNRFTDYITLVSRGATDADLNLPIFDYKGVPADFIGGEAEATFHLIEGHPHQVHVELRTDYVHAEDRQSGQPLPRIAPWRFGSALVYHYNSLVARLDIERVLEKRRLAQNEAPTDGYTMLDLSVSYRLSEGAITSDLYAKGSNLLDEEARNAVSFLKDIAPLPGRGVSGGVRIAF